MNALSFGLASQTLFLQQNKQLHIAQQPLSNTNFNKHVDILKTLEDTRDRQNKIDDKRNHKYVGKAITKFIDSLPYQEASEKDARKYAPIFLKPVRFALKKRNNYFRPSNHRRFKIANMGIVKVGNYKPKFTCLYGIVSDYYIKTFHHQALLFILIRNVMSMDDDGHPIFITNHLWIDPSFMECLMAKNSNEDHRVGLGDFIIFAGSINRYKKTFGNRYTYKYSLNNTYIASSGYPAIKNHKFNYGFYQYDHGRDCLCYLHDGKVMLGDQVSKQDKAYIRAHHLEVDNYAKLICARAVTNWLQSDFMSLNYKIDVPKVSDNCTSPWTDRTSVDFYFSNQIDGQTLVSKNETTIETDAAYLVWIRLKNQLQEHLYPYLLSIPHFYTK